MNSPEDEIPLPSVGVLSEEESAKQLREDACLKFTGHAAAQDRIRYLEGKAARSIELEAQLEKVSSALLIANRDLDAANAKLFHLKGRAICLYCQKEFEYKTAAGQQALADHICSCDMNPVTKGFKEIVTLSDELYSLVEAYLCTPNTEPAIEDHYKALVAWFVRNKRPDGSEPRPVSPEQLE